MERNNDDTIWLEATMTADWQPRVMMSYGGHSEVYPTERARQIGQALILAAAIAENEAAIFNGMEAQGKSRGFKKPALEDTPAAQALVLVRQFRPELEFGIEAIFGFRTRQPIVSMPWLTEPKGLQFSPAVARGLAVDWFASAEAAETDGFLRRFVQEHLELGFGDAQGLVLEFRNYRQRNTLEQQFGE